MPTCAGRPIWTFPAPGWTPYTSRTIHGHPFGLATVLDYAASARDVEQFAARTRRETTAHVRWIIRRYRTHARIGSTLDFINHLQESR